MADYDLKYTGAQIDALLDAANELKTAGYIYKGVATPSTNPGTPTERVAYLASEPGTYTNFGGIVIASGLYSLTYAGGTWTGTQMQAGSDIEVVQTTGQSASDVMSQKAVTDSLVGSVISYDNSQSGFASNNVQGALDDLAAGERYSQEEMDYSSVVTTSGKWINGGVWQSKSPAIVILIPKRLFENADRIKVVGVTHTRMMFLKSSVSTIGSNAPYCDGTGVMSIGANTRFYDIPSDCNYIYFDYSYDGVSRMPTSIQTIQSISSKIADIDLQVQQKDAVMNTAIANLLANAATVQDDDSSNDLNITDTNGNSIVELMDGEVRTKNFESRVTTQLMEDDSDSDLNITDPNGNVILSVKNGVVSSRPSNNDSDSTNAFLEAMREKASKMGLTITINGPAGYPDMQTSNGKSMAKLYAIASGYKDLAIVWNQKTDIRIYSKGTITTSHLLHSSVYGNNDGQNHWADDLTSYYDMLGGKTGSWGNTNLLGAVIKGPGDIVLVGWVRRTIADSQQSNRWKAMKTLMDIAFRKIETPSASIESLEQNLIDFGVESAQVLKIPNGNILNYEGYNFFNNDSRYEDFNIYGYNSDNIGTIASNTKVLTIITALDFFTNLDELVEIKAQDLVGGGTGSTPEFVAGEMFTVKELMLAMMMPSSNTAARALARFFGNKLLNNKYKGL